MRDYLENLIAGFSHFLNALTGGKATNSFSARMGAEAWHGSRFAWVITQVINTLLFSENHCLEHAIEEGLIP